ncbi:MAG: glycosyltransferase family 4 protein [Bdellovibrionales bacterium]|nr:glycosyltransferase family 4 protein [Bdellovibrionales bacterium]
MKIAFVVHENTLSGGAFVIYRHAHYLQSIGHDVSLLYYRVANANRIFYPNFKVKSYLLKDVHTANVRFDVVFATWWESFYYFHYVNAERYFYFVQSDERRFYNEIKKKSERDRWKSMVRLTYQFPEVGIITEAKWIKKVLEDEFRLKVEYAPNGVDGDVFHTNVKALAPKPKEKLRFLVEGHGTSPFKRVDLAFEALKPYRDQIEVWQIAGDGYRKKSWNPDRFFSKLSLKEMAPVYRSCDVLIKLSIVEGVFGPPLEMMACGNTALVSQVTGHDEYIVNEENSLSVPCDDIESTRRAIERFIEGGRPFVEQLSKNAVEKAKEMNWNNQHEKFNQAMLRLKDRVDPISEEVRSAIGVMERMKWALAGKRPPNMLNARVTTPKPVKFKP